MKSGDRTNMRGHFQKTSAAKWVEENFPAVWGKICEESVKRYPGKQRQRQKIDYSFVDNLEKRNHGD